MITEECFRVRGDIIAFDTIAEDEVFYALQHKTIKSFSTLTCKTLSHLSTEYLSSQTTAISFHKSMKLVAIANGKTIHIISTETQAVVQTLISYGGDIMILHFIQDSSYLIAGTTNGRVLQYRHDGKSMLSRLCSFPVNNPIGKRVIGKNYVGAIDSNEHYVVSSGYGGAITIIKLNSLTHKQTIQSARIRINLLKLISDELLISATIDKNIYFHDLTQYKSVKTITSPIGKISNIVKIPGSDYALISGESHKLLLLDLELKKIVANDFISCSENIKFFTLIEDHTVVVALESNTIETLSLSNPQELEELVNKNLLEKAFLLVEKNPLLKNTSAYIQLEKLYNNIYTKALNAFLASNQTQAATLLSPFSMIKSKKDDLALILDSFEQYKKFYTFILQKKYHIAYKISENFPTLQHTYQYEKLEQEFEKTFTFAQKQIALGRVDVAEEILSSYLAVKSKKALVNLLLKQHKNFAIFLKSIKENNYKSLATLIKEEPNFKQLPEYKKFRENVDRQLSLIKRDIYSTDLTDAIAKIKQLQYFTEIKTELKELYQLTNDVTLFLEAYEKNDFAAAYAIMDKTKSLENLELSQLLEKHWAKLIDQAESLALKGDLKGIKEVFGVLITLKSRSSRIGDILRLSFHTKIKQLLAKRTFSSIENIIYSYIDIFGLDTEIKTLMRSYEKLSGSKLAITTNQELYKDRDAWIDSEFIVGDHKK